MSQVENMLNAFRHHRFPHKAWATLRTHPKVCSTPFGITDFRTLCRRPCLHGKQGAQRLSASQISAQNASPVITPSMSCSTPFGITDFCTTWRPRRRTPYSSAQRLSASQISAHYDREQRRCVRLVLNAFRHHRFLHKEELTASEKRDLCSTPFGITDFCTDTCADIYHYLDVVLNAFRHHRFLHNHRPPLERDGLLVLNAFRHHRFLHWLVDIPVLWLRVCSTPFGITDFCTRSPTRDPRSSCGAQRLSASQISAPSLSRESRGAARVLNAFRHHRFLHFLTTRRSSIWLCAQRLSASQISAQSSPPPGCFRGPCAQRLSASQISALSVILEMRLLHLVLNAFRHHRFLHRKRIIGSRLTAGVLNAFRHHRFLHRSRHRTTRTPRRCAQRLSASQISAPSSSPCVSIDTCAQRLSASQISALRLAGPPKGLKTVLNAFRHHRFLHSTEPSALSVRVSAQRLSASQISAHRVQHDDLMLVPVCSTPFGITDFCTGSGGGRYPCDAVLNAFRHHRFLHGSRVTICFLRINNSVCHVPP